MPRFNVDLTAELVAIERANFTIEADNGTAARRIVEDMLSRDPHNQAV
jgi:hypothetical protein